MRILAKAFFLTSLTLFCLTLPGYGQAPTTIAYQGRLTDLTGEPVTTTQSVVFLIYSVPTGSQPLWAETLLVSPDYQGIFTTELGTLSPLTGDLFSGDKRYLTLKVGEDAEMSPRQRLTSAPYAIAAENIPEGSVSTERLADSAVTEAKLANNAVSSSKVQNSSLEAVDLLNEPGLGFVLSLPTNLFRAIPLGTSVLDSIMVDVPDSGYVYVWAHADIGVDHINGVRDWLWFQISNVRDTIIPNNFGFAMLDIPASLPSQDSTAYYAFPVEAHRPFLVEQSGEYKFYFNAKVSYGSGNDDGFYNLQITAMYFPTAYGTVMLSPPESSPVEGPALPQPVYDGATE